MSLKYKFRKALEILDRFDPAGREELVRTCHKLRTAEADLQTAAKPLLEICNTRCEGLCCRNIEPDALISLGDMIYILAVDGDVSPAIRAALEEEKPFFTSKCIFLKEGVGPCIFRWDVRPEICITSFCFSDVPVKKEIAKVKRRFFKLRWYIAFRNFRYVRSIF